VPGTHQGNALVQTAGREPGRAAENTSAHRTARDATSINPKARDPILPSLMPYLPPA
jgi:hypothetical protein